MLGAAGGHGDYAGNEVDALALNVPTPAWKQLRGPTPNSQVINLTQFYLDDRPAATHTYYATQFIDELNRMVVFASPGLNGKLFPAAPADFPYVGATRSFSFDVAAGDWDSPNYIAQFPDKGNYIACLCVKHPWTGDVYYSRGGGDGWYRWTRISNTWSRLSGEGKSSWYAGTAIDPRRNRLLAVGGYHPPPPEVRNLDGSRIPATFTGLGASALTIGNYPGVIYDETLDRYIVLHNSGGLIKTLRVHPETWLVDEPTVFGKLPDARQNGILNSVQYVPELKGFAIANSYHGNVSFMRTAA
jgi:hypothetical protein